MNNSTLIGRIANVLELKEVGDSVVCNFDLAIDRKGSKEKITDFIPCELWGNRAKALVENSGKGKLLGVRGEIHVNSYKDTDNKSRKSFSIYVTETDILEWKNTKNQE